MMCVYCPLFNSILFPYHQRIFFVIVQKGKKQEIGILWNSIIEVIIVLFFPFYVRRKNNL
jgi:hypothetical protein